MDIFYIIFIFIYIDLFSMGDRYYQNARTLAVHISLIPSHFFVPIDYINSN